MGTFNEKKIMETLENIDATLEEIQEDILAVKCEVGVKAEDVNSAAALANIAVKLLDTVSYVHQVHNNVVRLGRNLDLMVTSLNTYSRDFGVTIEELKMRVEDLEKLKVSGLESDFE